MSCWRTYTPSTWSAVCVFSPSRMAERMASLHESAVRTMAPFLVRMATLSLALVHLVNICHPSFQARGRQEASHVQRDLEVMAAWSHRMRLVWTWMTFAIYRWVSIAPLLQKCQHLNLRSSLLVHIGQQPWWCSDVLWKCSCVGTWLAWGRDHRMLVHCLQLLSMTGQGRWLM